MDAESVKQLFELSYLAVVEFIRAALPALSDWGYPRDREDLTLRAFYEVELVSAIWLYLHRNHFRYKVIRECPYPGNKGLWADLGFRDSNNLRAILEIKIWRKETDEQLRQDVLKLNTVPVDIRRMVLLFAQGGIWPDNLQYLRKSDLPLRLVYQRSSNVFPVRAHGHLDEARRLDAALFEMS